MLKLAEKDIFSKVFIQLTKIVFGVTKLATDFETMSK